MSKYCFIKRIFDIVFGYILLLASYIPMGIISLIILIFDGRPVIFKQTRVGQGGKRFVCYKFRTMKNEAPQDKSKKEMREISKYITPLGKFLRRTSLDELPQLLNVISGDMSLIGPRPLIPNEIDVHIKRNELGVYRIKPGITGLSQICGRDDITDLRKIECDAIYVNNISFLNDLKILKSTILNVIRRDGNIDDARWVLDINTYKRYNIIRNLSELFKWLYLKHKLRKTK